MVTAAKRKRSLSDLPDIAVDKILSHLPIKDAARTATLSRYWRHRWKSIPDLNLSDDLYPHEISTVLDLHSGPIRLFNAKQPRDANDWTNEDVDSWLSTLLLRAASTLRVFNLRFNGPLDIDLVAHGFPNLTHLKLRFCYLMQPRFHVFAALRSLHLNVGCKNVRGVSRLISACPLLEMLSLRTEDMRQRLRIVAPNLRWLQLVAHQIEDLPVIRTPLLEVALICCYFRVDFENAGSDNEDGGDGGGDDEDGGDGSDNDGGSDSNGSDDDGSENCNLIKVFRDMAFIKVLELNDGALTYLGKSDIPERIPINFDHLRVLSLDADLGDMKTVLVTLCLLRSTPNLQELRIKSWGYDDKVLETGNNFWDAQKHVDLFDKLETVTMTWIYCKQDELDFIQFLLAKARVLKTITINLERDVRNKESVMTELLGFPRISSQARILLTR